MTALCSILFIICLTLIGKIMLQKHQIRKIIHQVDYLYERDTQTVVRLERSDRETQRLVIGINRLAEKYLHSSHQIERNEVVFRDTITSLSHDLRTPLATANGYVQLLLEQDLTDDQREYAAIAGERITAVKQLLDQLFEFARIEANELSYHHQRLDLNSILRDALAIYYADFEHKNEVPTINIPDQPIFVWADKDALFRVFSNVLYNALIHGNGGYEISVERHEERCAVTIANCSNGIGQEDIPHLFDRFYTTDHSRTKKTTGLGLAIASKLSSQMGGSISASLHSEIFGIHIEFPCP